MAVNDFLRDHGRHDELLVVAYTAGDLSGADARRASELVAGCPECDRLAADVRELSSAVASLPTPRRTRDFRLSDADARHLRPAGWRGALSWLAAPRLAFAAPLGTAVAALGLAGLLVTTAPALVGTFGTGASRQAAAPVTQDSGAAAPNLGVGAAATAVAGAGSQGAAPLAVPAPTSPAPELKAGAVAASPATAATEPAVGAAGVAPEPTGASSAGAAPEAASAAASASGASDAASTPATAGKTGGGPSPLAVVSSLLVVLGLALVLGRVAAARAARR